MRDSEEKYLESLSDKMLRDLSTERPSLGFLNRVMGAVAKERLVDTSRFRYDPLIPKWGWAVLSVISITLLFFIASSDPASNSVMQNKVINDLTTTLPEFNLPVFSELAGWSSLPFIMLGLMTIIYIPILKRLVDEKLIQ